MNDENGTADTSRPTSLKLVSQQVAARSDGDRRLAPTTINYRDSHGIWLKSACTSSTVTSCGFGRGLK